MPWVARRSELMAAGASRRRIERAAREGSIVRVRPGWYASPGLDEAEQTAARVGGLVTCISEARHLGWWIPPGCDERLHLHVPEDARTRSPEGVRVHRRPSTPLTRRSERLHVGPVVALEQIVRCQPPLVAFVLAESARARGDVSARDLERVRSCVGPRLATRLAGVGARSGSGTESAFVFRVRRFGLRVRQQVWVGIDRVDTVVGDGLVVELDSRGYHDTVRDAHRDARVAILGHDTIGFTYDQVWFDWASVEEALLATLARRALRSYRPGRR